MFPEAETYLRMVDPGPSKDPPKVAYQPYLIGRRVELHGLIRSDECYHTLLEAHLKMPVRTTGQPSAVGYGRKSASAVRSNLAVAALLRERSLAGMQRAHRLLTMALLCDDENAAAFHNLLQLGGQAACADLADHGESSGDPQKCCPGEAVSVVVFPSEKVGGDSAAVSEW